MGERVNDKPCRGAASTVPDLRANSYAVKNFQKISEQSAGGFSRFGDR